MLLNVRYCYLLLSAPLQKYLGHKDFKITLFQRLTSFKRCLNVMCLLGYSYSVIVGMRNLPTQFFQPKILKILSNIFL